MREHYISGITIEYPDPIIWLGDNNTITIRSSVSTDHVGARVAVMAPNTQQIVLDYYSDTNSLVFLLNDTLKQLYSESLSEWDVLVQAYNSQTPLDDFYFTMKVYDGKSYPDRSHAAARVIYWSDVSELSKFQLFTYESGTATVAGTNFALAGGISSLNLSDLRLDDTEIITVQTTAVNPTTPLWLGDLWYNSRVPSTAYTVTLKHINVCDNNFNVCRLFYTDADGCSRWIGGKITKVTDNAQGDTYATITEGGIYKNIVKKWNTKTSKVVTVAFSDVDNLAYLQDILFSDNVYMVNYNGDLFSVAIDTKKLTVKDFVNDFEIDFVVNNDN